MILAANVGELADNLGVGIRAGCKIDVSGKSANDVIAALTDSGFKFLGYFDLTTRIEKDKYYFIVGHDLLVANTNTASLPMEPLIKKPGYRAIDGF